MSPHTHAALPISSTAPSSLTCAFIIDGVDTEKASRDSEVRHHKARRLSLPLASVDEQTSAMEQLALPSPGADAWAPEVDEDSVECPEDICHLEIEWDLNAWNEMQDHERAEESGEPQKLLEDDASPSSAAEGDSTQALNQGGRHEA